MPYQLRVGPNVTQSTTAIINDATETNDGVMTMAMVKALKDASSEGAKDDVFIYVNSVSGNDNKDGSTPAKAVMTLAKALSLVPCCWAKHCQLIFAPGTYPFSRDTFFYLGEPVGPASVAIAFIGAFTNELGTRTATAISNGESIKDGALILAPDAYFGAFLRCTVGVNAGQRRMIASNTINQFNLNSPFSNPVSVGDKFVVEKPAVTFDITGRYVPNGGGNSQIYKGIKWELNGGVFATNKALMIMEGCEIQNGFYNLFHHANLEGGSFPVPAGGASDPLNPMSDLRFQAGVYLHDLTLQWNAFGFSLGFFMMKDSTFNVFDQVNLVFEAFYARNVGFYPFNCTSVKLFGTDTNGFGGTSRAVWDNVDFSSGNSAYLNANDFDINNSPNDGIYFQSGRAEIYNIGGAGNAGSGIFIQALASLDTGGGSDTITGAGGDLMVGTTPVLWGGFAPTTDLVELCRAT